MTRVELTERIVQARLAKKISWKDLAEGMGRSEVWTTSALLGQQTMNSDEAATAGRLLGLSNDEVALLQVPRRRARSPRPSRRIRSSTDFTRSFRSTGRR
jgi:cyanate lyase